MSRWGGEDSVIRKQVICNLHVVITSSLIITKQNKHRPGQYGVLWRREEEQPARKAQCAAASGALAARLNAFLSKWFGSKHGRISFPQRASPTSGSVEEEVYGRVGAGASGGFM